MNKEYLINHLKDMAKIAEQDSKNYREDDNIAMEYYKDGLKDGLEIAINWLELEGM